MLFCCRDKFIRISGYFSRVAITLRQTLYEAYLTSMFSSHIFRSVIRTRSLIYRKVPAVCYVSNYVDSSHHKNIRRQIVDCLQSQRICTSARYMAYSDKMEHNCAQNDQSKEPMHFQTDYSESSPTLFHSESEVHPKTSPPASVLGMKVLDKEKFVKKVTVQALPVPRKNLKLLSKYVKEWTLKEFPVKTVKEMGTEKEKQFKIVHFHPDKVTCVEDLEEDLKNKLIEAEVDLSEWFEDEIELNYDSWKAKDILQAIIPKELGTVSGYSIIGHIIHLNLKENLLEYKEIIGQVLLEKHSYIRTVVNKLNIIDNTFRNFKMEILAGEDDTATTVKENGITFKFDFAKVYWNTRLGNEHARIANLLKKGDLMFDVFAGVGPFAVLAGRRGVDVFANDLNPHSYESLVENVTFNKVKTKVTCSNLDGRDFIRSVMKPELFRRWQEDYIKLHKIFVVMNLPGLAVTFLDEFIGLLSDKACDQDKYPDHLLPVVHCHVFGKAADTRQAAKELAEENLGEPLPDDATIKFVRNVAPNKDMYCVAFTVPRQLLFRSDKNTKTSQQHANEEPPEKKMKPCDDQ